jgi:hypothetical protein
VLGALLPRPTTIAVEITANHIGALTTLAKVGALLHMGSAAPSPKAKVCWALLGDPAKTRVTGGLARWLTVRVFAGSARRWFDVCLIAPFLRKRGGQTEQPSPKQ